MFFCNSTELPDDLGPVERIKIKTDPESNNKTRNTIFGGNIHNKRHRYSTNSNCDVFCGDYFYFDMRNNLYSVLHGIARHCVGFSEVRETVLCSGGAAGLNLYNLYYLHDKISVL